MRRLALLSLSVLFADCGACAETAFRVSAFFADHMVLQRGEAICVWGNATPGADVDVVLAEQRVAAKADAQGQWLATLAPREASGPLELRAASGAEEHVVRDVMVGDVWLISGQSNVVLPVSAGADWPELRQLPVFGDIRVCKLPGQSAFEPAKEFTRPLAWDRLNTAKVGSYLSGVGYHFVRTVQPAVGVTVGLVQASAGGTQIEQWTPEAALRAADPTNAQFAVRDKARALLAADPIAKIGGIQSGACGLYDGTVHPMRFAKWKGVVWYQGEANSRVKADYRLLLTTLVSSWRKVFDQPNLPFVIVQLPNFGLPKDDGWMRLQEAQMLAARDLDLPLVVTIDQGSATTIHPPNKTEVGRRAGLAALQHVYGQNADGTSPTPRSLTFTGASAVVEFGGFEGDLVVRGGTVAGFELAGADHVFLPATVEVEGRRVAVTAAGVPRPQALRYLWVHSPESVTLYSAAGLPAMPFRSDAWPTGDVAPWRVESPRP